MDLIATIDGDSIVDLLKEKVLQGTVLRPAGIAIRYAGCTVTLRTMKQAAEFLQRMAAVQPDSASEERT